MLREFKLPKITTRNKVCTRAKIRTVKSFRQNGKRYYKKPCVNKFLGNCSCQYIWNINKSAKVNYIFLLDHRCI